MAQINLRIDDDVKRNAEQVCADIGLSLSTAINIYLKKLGREKRIPFEVTADPFYSDENMARLREAIRSVETGKSTLKEHDLIEVDG
ncbi:MAG: type II toxin-antitoxin system RelB/DinJ family antitoxin [Oscillospiraceae bacterium]|nr:type II toxin-antitoxin system RelB/DinJ family antitoxin [Oscillospiraceae bacterium]